MSYFEIILVTAGILGLCWEIRSYNKKWRDKEEKRKHELKLWNKKKEIEEKRY